MKTRIYAIGDVHGRRDLLEQLYLRIFAHAVTEKVARRVLVHLGDYIDRGPDSKGVIERIMAGLPPFESIALLGNHEQVMLDYLDSGSAEAADQWLDLGGADTVRSFGLDPKRGLDRNRLIRAIGRDKLRWLRSLPVSYREGGLFFVHAGVRPGVPMVRQSRDDLLWIRDVFTNSDENFGVRIVHGHSPTQEPIIKANQIGIDTGAIWTGRLTAAVLDPERPQDEPLLLSTFVASEDTVLRRRQARWEGLAARH